MKTSMSLISIFVLPLAQVGSGPAGGRQVPHPRLRKTSAVLRWVVPLISGHQRSAASGDFRPRIIYGQEQDAHAHSNWPSSQGVGKVGSGGWLGDELDGAFWLS